MNRCGKSLVILFENQKATHISIALPYGKVTDFVSLIYNLKTVVGADFVNLIYNLKTVVGADFVSLIYNLKTVLGAGFLSLICKRLGKNSI